MGSPADKSIFSNSALRYSSGRTMHLVPVSISNELNSHTKYLRLTSSQTDNASYIARPSLHYTKKMTDV